MLLSSGGWLNHLAQFHVLPQDLDGRWGP